MVKHHAHLQYRHIMLCCARLMAPAGWGEKFDYDDFPSIWSNQSTPLRMHACMHAERRSEEDRRDATRRY
jgi:hypothetical protein